MQLHPAQVVVLLQVVHGPNLPEPPHAATSDVEHGLGATGARRRRRGLQLLRIAQRPPGGADRLLRSARCSGGGGQRRALLEDVGRQEGGSPSTQARPDQHGRRYSTWEDV